MIAVSFSQGISWALSRNWDQDFFKTIHAVFSTRWPNWRKLETVSRFVNWGSLPVYREISPFGIGARSFLFWDICTGSQHNPRHEWHVWKRGIYSGSADIWICFWKSTVGEFFTATEPFPWAQFAETIESPNDWVCSSMEIWRTSNFSGVALGVWFGSLYSLVIWNGAEEISAMVLSPVLAQVPEYLANDSRLVSDINKDVNVIYFLWRRVLQEWLRKLPNQTLQRGSNMCVWLGLIQQRIFYM